MGNGPFDFAALEYGWQSRIKMEAWEKINNSLLIKSCASGDLISAISLLAGFWNFVDRFPGIIDSTFTVIPAEISPQLKKFLKRSAPILAGTLKEMENDERNHRVLWLNASSVVGLEMGDLMNWEVLSEIDKISASISRAEIKEKLLAFVAVEIIAEGISQNLSKAIAFKELMGKKGISWFSVHVVHPDDGTTHEDIAYNTATQIYHVEGVPVSENSLNMIIQKYVDLFINAAEACRVKFLSKSITV